MKAHRTKLFITGGTGFLGRHLVKKYYNHYDITVYSRDESKQYYLKKEFPNINCVIGDINNYERLLSASKGHKYAIFAASMKQISAVDQNVEEAVNTIINGGINSKKVAIENKMVSAVFISSDKSNAASTLYGSMKFIAGENFILNNENHDVQLNTVLYGNVTNSTGSIIPLIFDTIKNNRVFTLYSTEMTRFMVSISEALETIDLALFATYNNKHIAPFMNSYKVTDLVELYKEEFNLKTLYKLELRIGEKLHESIYTEEVAKFIQPFHGYMIWDYQNEFHHYEGTYNSNESVMTKNQLRQHLMENNYYA